MESKVAASQFGLAGSQTQTLTMCVCKAAGAGSVPRASDTKSFFLAVVPGTKHEGSHIQTGSALPSKRK